MHKLFREKVIFFKISTESEIFLKDRVRNLKQGEMHHGLRGDVRPCTSGPYKRIHVQVVLI